MQSDKLTVIGGENLKSLSTGDGKLTTLDVSKCTSLTSLDCSGMQSDKLTVIGGENLKSLSTGNGKLTTLDVSKCTSLTYLDCRNNQLTSLDLSGCTSLTSLYINNNQLTSSALNSLFSSLPVNNGGSIYIVGNPGASDCDKSIATSKGWYVQ
jgi:Leucine-rich repeat (LRR) protein